MVIKSTLMLDNDPNKGEEVLAWAPVANKELIR